MALRSAGDGLPAWPGAIAGATCIEAKSRYGHKYMAVSDIDGDPITFALFPVFEKSSGSERALHQAGFAQYVGGAAGAIVAIVMMVRMAASPFVRHPLEAIPGSDRALYGGRGIAGCVGDAVFEHSRAAVIKTVGNRLLRLLLIGAGGGEGKNRKDKQKQEKRLFHVQ